MTDVRSLIDNNPITSTQIAVFLSCFALNMLDGMDVLIIAFAAPVISEEWSIAPQALGVVFSAGLIGMTVGAMFLAPIADIIGRRNTIMICIVVMASGVFLTAYAQSTTQLILVRAYSGLGIGAMLATVATMAAEFAPERNKNFIVSVSISGYPVGATLAGLVAAQIIPELGWRAMFITAAVATAAMLPVVVFMLPESLNFLIDKHPRGALERLNRTLRRMNAEPLTNLPTPSKEAAERPGVSALLGCSRATSTLLLWLAFFMAFVTLYFLTSWIPKLAHNTGLSLDIAIYAGAVFNRGGFFGIACKATCRRKAWGLGELYLLS